MPFFRRIDMQTTTFGSYQIDYWYRHVDDPDQTVRAIPQMTAGTSRPPHEEIRSLQSQGYIIQRAELYALCPRCAGAGQVPKLPKDARKDRPYTPVYVECGVCHGQEYARVQLFPMPQDAGILDDLLDATYPNLVAAVDEVESVDDAPDDETHGVGYAP